MNGHVPEDMFSTVFFVGDLIWTKVGKYPFWPCMVTYDPSDTSFIKFVKSQMSLHLWDNYGVA
ncbi:unnamed protein product [Larinioides sclopetarius]|uniref:PWWP domain-containing protein n=1 Tax=Larinioides sclopetarius TaxID=280406 RepID=A0AAV1Z1V2_9ARAC